jgi:malate dehydrogenase (oxaloacetate-decarboxylating)
MPIDRIRAMELHRRARGKIKIYPTINIVNEEDLSMVYIPGSVGPCQAIQEDLEASFDLTGRANRIAVITDGSAVLGLGDVGPVASLPVMEGKCLLFKIFADVNALPICLDSKNPADVIHTAELLAPCLGGFNIEDISSPNTFTVVKELQKKVSIPVLCDDQHGTAVVILAALWNALEVVGKSIEKASIVICGAGAAGLAVADLFLKAGARGITILNSAGILCPSNPKMNHLQLDFASRTNPEGRKGGLEEAVKGADVFIGLSKGNLLNPEWIRTMAADPVIFAQALPEPEIMPEAALAAGAAIVASGLYDYPNVISNLHSTPGIMRGALDVRAASLNDAIFLAAARALSSTVDRRRLGPRHIMPDLFCDEVVPKVAEAVAQTAVSEGLAALPLPKGQVYNDTWERLFGGRASRL